ncbi:MAG: phospholipase D-like domain-containing protein [Actinomycetes bacterium]
MVRGTNGPDTIIGTADRDVVDGGPGADSIVTREEKDRIWGGAGYDWVSAGTGDDRVIVSGDGSRDSVDCGPGNDVVLADPADNVRNCEVVSVLQGDRTPHINRVVTAIRNMEERTGSDSSEGILWNLTQGNALPALGTANPEWITRTTDCWGVTTSCDSSRVQGQLTSTIRSIIGNARTLVDISSLSAVADGGFRQAIIDGAADAQRAGRRPLIRMMWGRQPLAPFDAPLRDLQRDVQAAAPDLTVVASLMSNTLVLNGYSWNHSKIVAADSRVAWAAGINLWSRSYLQSTNPVTDLGVVVRGPAAADPSRFLDVLWTFTCENSGFGLRYNNTIIPAGGGPGGCPAKKAPAPGGPEGDVTVLSLGRAGYINTGKVTGRKDPGEVSRGDKYDSGCIIPPLPNPMNGNPRWDGNNPSDTALRALVRSADSKVVITQQNLIFDCARDPSYDVRLLDAIAEQVRDGVKVTIVVSNKDAVIKALEEEYGGGADSSRAVVMKRLTKLMGSSSLAKEAACRSLTVAPFRFSSLTTWPGSNAPGLHSKVIAVDDQAVMVGSQNAYPNQLQEFGYLIEDSRAMADMKRLFLDPIESNARAAALPCG